MTEVDNFAKITARKETDLQTLLLIKKKEKEKKIKKGVTSDFTTVYHTISLSI